MINRKTVLVSATALSLSLGASAAFAQDAGSPQLEEIVVTADRPDSFGADFLQAGTFRNGHQMDTPLTVSVIPEKLLEAQLASSVLDALRNTPGVTTAAINASVYSNLSVRGIPVENRGNWRLNGSLPIVNLIDLPLENKMRVEALKGASALYYGFSTPSGIVNLVTKRATADPVTALRTFGNIHGQAGGHVDIGRRFGDFGVRVNALAANLETGVARTEGHRWFTSAALDWEPSDSFSLQLDGEYIYKTLTEPTTLRPYSQNGVLTLPPIVSLKRNVGSQWFKSPAREYNLLARAEYKISSAWALTFNAGVSNLKRDRRFSDFRFTNPTIANPTLGPGTLTVELANDNSYENVYFRGEIAGTFDTGPLRHEIIVGASSNRRDAINPRVPTVAFVQDYFDPIVVPETPMPARALLNTSKIEDVGLYAFDRVSYDDFVYLTVGVRYTDFKDDTRNFSAAGVETSRVTYKTKPTSWSAGLLVKPVSWISVYGTYIEGLENSRVAPAGTINAGESLPAAVSEQKEFGIKAEFGRLMATAAYFEIERGSSFTNAENRFVLDGLARYKGAEFSLTGEIVPSLSIYASALVLDTKQISGSTNVGNDIENAPKFSGSVFLEYDLPVVEGLAVSAGVFRVGKRYGNAANAYQVPGYTTFDVGASYTTETLIGKETTFRIYADNVTGKKYWSSASSSLLAPGLPPSVRFSIETSF